MRATGFVVVVITFVTVALVAYAIILAVGWKHHDFALLIAAIVACQVGALIWHRQAPASAVISVKLGLGAVLAVTEVVFSLVFQFVSGWLEYPAITVPIAAIGCFLFPFAIVGTLWKAAVQLEATRQQGRHPRNIVRESQLTTKRILNVGQCMADTGSVTRTFTRAFGAEVISVHFAREALALLRAEGFDLVLVNRVFDADGDSGLDLIRTLQSDEKLRGVPVMLVSNYPEAQAEAVSAGALPGFGKAALGAPTMLEQMAGVLGAKAK